MPAPEMLYKELRCEFSLLWNKDVLSKVTHYKKTFNVILRVQFIRGYTLWVSDTRQNICFWKECHCFSQRIKKSTKSVIMLIKHFSIVLKLIDREVTIINETNFLVIFLLFNKFLNSSWENKLSYCQWHNLTGKWKSKWTA